MYYPLFNAYSDHAIILTSSTKDEIKAYRD